jgi:hypothetical protein
MSKDYEYLLSSSESMVCLTMIRLMVKRLARAAEVSRESMRQTQAAWVAFSDTLSQSVSPVSKTL